MSTTPKAEHPKSEKCSASCMCKRKHRRRKSGSTAVSLASLSPQNSLDMERCLKADYSSVLARITVMLEKKKSAEVCLKELTEEVTRLEGKLTPLRENSLAQYQKHGTPVSRCAAEHQGLLSSSTETLNSSGSCAPITPEADEDSPVDLDHLQSSEHDGASRLSSGLLDGLSGAGNDGLFKTGERNSHAHWTDVGSLNGATADERSSLQANARQEESLKDFVVVGQEQPVSFAALPGDAQAAVDQMRELEVRKRQIEAEIAELKSELQYLKLQHCSREVGETAEACGDEELIRIASSMSASFEAPDASVTLNEKRSQVSDHIAALAALDKQSAELEEKKSDINQMVLAQASALQSYEEELGAIASSVRALAGQKAKAEAEAEQARASLESAIAKRDNIQNALASVQQELAEAQNLMDKALESKKTTEVALEEEKHHLETSAGRLLEDLDVQRKENLKRAQEIERLREVRTLLLDEQEKLTAQCSEVQSAVDTHREALEKTHQETKKMVEEIEKLNRTRESLGTKKQTLKKEIELQEKKLGELQTEEESLKAQLEVHESRVKDSGEAIRNLQKCLIESEKELALIQEKKAVMMEKTKEEHVALETLQQSIKEEEATWRSLEQERQQWAEKKTTIIYTVDELKKNISELEAICKEQSQRKGVLEQELQINVKATEELSDRLEVARKERVDTEGALRETKAMCESLTNEMKTAVQEKTVLKDRFEALVASSNELAEQVSSKENAIEALNAKTAELEEKKLALETRLASQVRTFEEEIQKEKSQLEHEKSETLALKRLIEEETVLTGTLRLEHEKLLAVSQLLRQQLETLQDETASTRESLVVAEQEHKNLETTLRTTKENYGALEKEISSAHAAVEALKSNLLEKVAEKEQVKASLAETQQMSDTLCVAAEEAMRNAEAQRQVHEAALCAEQEAIRDIEIRRDQLRARLSALREELTTTESECAQTEQDVQLAQERVISFQENQKTLEAEENVLDAQLQSLKHSCTAKQTEFDSVNAKYQEIQLQVINTQSALAQEKERLDFISTEVLEAQKAVAEKTNALEALHNDKKALDEEHDALQKQIIVLRTNKKALNGVEQELQEVRRSLEALAVEAQEKNKAREDLEMQRQAVDEELSLLNSALAERRTAHSSRAEELENLEQMISSHRAAVNEKEREIAKLTEKEEALRVEAKARVSSFEHEMMRHEKLINDQVKQEQALASAKEALQGIEREITELGKRHAAAEKQRHETENAIQELESKNMILTKELECLKAETLKLVSRVEKESRASAALAEDSVSGFQEMLAVSAEDSAPEVAIDPKLAVTASKSVPEATEDRPQDAVQIVTATPQTTLPENEGPSTMPLVSRPAIPLTVTPSNGASLPAVLTRRQRRHYHRQALQINKPTSAQRETDAHTATEVLQQTRAVTRSLFYFLALLFCLSIFDFIFKGPSLINHLTIICFGFFCYVARGVFSPTSLLVYPSANKS